MRDKCVKMPLYPLHISHGLPLDFTQASAVTE